VCTRRTHSCSHGLRRERATSREDAMTAAIFVISINLLLIGSLAIRDR
jgi:hypothetical protein